MKKFIILALLAICGLSSYAQMYLGGSLGLTRDFTAKETNFTVAPEWGYSYSEHWGVGIVLDYTYKNYTGTISNSFAFNPYARWTFARVADDKLAFLLDGGFTIGFVGTPNTTTSVYANVGLKPGICYSFNEHWSILTHFGFLGYQGANSKAKALGYHEKLGFDFSSMNVNLGVYYTF